MQKVCVEAVSQETAPRATQSHLRGWDLGLLKLNQKVIITSKSQLTEQLTRDEMVKQFNCSPKMLLAYVQVYVMSQIQRNFFYR